MFFAERDEKGEIIAIRTKPQHSDQPEATSAEVLNFFFQGKDCERQGMLLNMLDIKVIRVLDDLIDLLVRKNIILFDDLPVEAQNKVRERKRARGHLGEDDTFIPDELL